MIEHNTYVHHVFVYDYISTKTLYGSTHASMNLLYRPYPFFGPANPLQQKYPPEKQIPTRNPSCERSLELASLCLQSDLELILMVEIVSVDGSLMEEIP